MDHTVSQLKLLERHTTGISFLNDIKGCLDILSEYLGAMGYALITFQPTSSRQPVEGARFNEARVIYSTLDEGQEFRYVHMPLRGHVCAEMCEGTGPFALSWSPVQEAYAAEKNGIAEIATQGEAVRCIAVPDPALNFAAIIMHGAAEIADIAKNAIWYSFGTRLAKETLKLTGDANPFNLSDREKQCLLWCSRGKTTSDIASILGLSDHTVNHYLTSAALKLNAVNRTHAIAKALRHGIIPLHDL